MAFDKNFLNPNFLMGSTGTINSQDSKMASDEWMQIAPSSIPWTMQNRPDIVRFGETADDGNWTLHPNRSLICDTGLGRRFKRKLIDFPDKPAKVHLTEEKMAAQLENMHISNNYTNNQGFKEDADDPGERLLPTLVLSKEVQNLRAFEDPILPDLILPKLDMPTKALVLWQPPAGKLPPLTWNLNPEEEKDSTNNNETANNDPYRVVPFRSSSQTAETEMEL